MSSFLRELKRRNVVRVAILYAVVGWVVAQVADLTMPRLGIPEWGVSLVLMLLVLGFPVALVFAWIFELTPEGLKRTQEVERHASTAHLTGRKLDFLIIGVLAAALVFVGYQAYAPRLKTTAGSQTRKTPGDAKLASIAVLPFVDMSQAKDQEYLTDGISEELLNVLARVEGFKVTGRTSAFAFKGHNEDLRVIGQKLGVDHILEGSVRKQGDRIRVTAQLVKASDGYHLWSETYDRQLDDVFAVQDDIAKQVVAAIRRALGKPEGAANAASPAEGPPTGNVQAYTHFLRGQQLLRARDRVGMEAALTEFERAVELDGDFSRAHVGIAKSLALLASYGERGLAEVEARIEEELSRAAELKPGLADAYATRALWLDVKSAPEKEQIPLLERAADASRSDTETLVWLSRAYGNSGRLQDALRTFERAYSLDPLYPLMLSNYAIVTYSVGYVDRAGRLIDELATLQPNSPILFRTRSILADMDTRPDQSIRWLAAAAKLDPEDASTAVRLTNDYWALGDAATGLRHATRLSELTPRDSWGPALQVGLRVLAGDLAKARSSLAAVEAMFPDDHSDVAAARGVVHTAAGEFTKALEALLESAPVFRDEVPVITWGNNYWNAPLTAFLFRKTDNDAQARRIADALMRAGSVAAPHDGQPRSWPLPERAAMAAVMGDRAQLVESLTKLYDNGGMIPAVMSSEPLSEPWFRPYRGDIEIEALFAKFDARRKEWRRQLAAEGL